MFNKISRILSLFTFSIFIASTTFFVSLKPVDAVQMNVDNIEDNSMDIRIQESNDGVNAVKSSAAPDLGDDQAFPFIPGFGKNSGKD